MIFDFGFERQELIYPNKHFGLGEYHNLVIRRKNSGATLVMEVRNCGRVIEKMSSWSYGSSIRR